MSKAKNVFKEFCWFEDVDAKVSHHWVCAKTAEEAAEKFLECGFNGGIIKEGMEGFDPMEDKDKAELLPNYAKEVEEHNAKLGMEQVTVTYPDTVYPNEDCKEAEGVRLENDVLFEIMDYVRNNSVSKFDAVQKFSKAIYEEFGVRLVGGYCPLYFRVHKRHRMAKNWNRLLGKPYVKVV